LADNPTVTGERAADAEDDQNSEHYWLAWNHATTLLPGLPKQLLAIAISPATQAILR